MTRISPPQIQILSLTGGGNGASRPIYAQRFKVAKIVIVVTGSYNGLVKFFESDSDTPPDFTLPASDANQYSPIQCLDDNNGNAIPGYVGIDFSAVPYNVDDVYTFSIQTEGHRSLGMAASNATQGDLKAYIKLFDDANPIG